MLSDLKGDGKFSGFKKPLLNLDLDHIVPDELHLMLRVTDVLTKALILTAQTYDKHQHKVLCIRCAYKVLDGELVRYLIKAIPDSRIYFKVYEDTGKIDQPSLLGPDKLKLFKQLRDKMSGCQPEDMQCSK